VTNVTTAKIADAAVTNAKLDKANIPLSGFAAAAADVDLGTSFKLINVLDPTLAQDAATKNYVDTALNSSNVLATKCICGNINGEAAAVALSGDVTITNAGVANIETDVTTAKILDGTILAADIAADAVTTKILDGTILAAISQLML
jgi:hypothetical protein